MRTAHGLESYCSDRKRNVQGRQGPGMSESAVVSEESNLIGWAALERGAPRHSPEPGSPGTGKTSCFEPTHAVYGCHLMGVEYTKNIGDSNSKKPEKLHRCICRFQATR